jgi:hypothetical protein
MRVSAGFSGYAVQWGGGSLPMFYSNIFPCIRDKWGFQLRLSSAILNNTMFRQLDLFLSSGEGVGDKYSLGSVTKS